jgi:hypothetical protein
MIGPHQGKELELMLAGTKKLALFHDALTADETISEEIIPEKAFAPYVERGQIIRAAKDVHVSDGSIIRYVCFALPGEEWRMQFCLWLAEQRTLKLIPPDDACDIIVGRLLGYSEEDIEHFLHVRC